VAPGGSSSALATSHGRGYSGGRDYGSSDHGNGRGHGRNHSSRGGVAITLHVVAVLVVALPTSRLGRSVKYA
jgi:hypothetical protein